MANLFWTQKGKKTLNLVSTPFKSEQEFEEFIFEHEEILQDIFIIKRQVRGGKKPGIPDMIGIDSDGNVCIIEMKNAAVDEKIFSQILAYAIWATKNPDSLKNLWYELDDKPDVEFTGVNYEVRILVIAPDIDPDTLSFLSSIQYKVDFIEIKRWSNKKDSFLLVNYLEQKEDKKTQTVRGIEVYDKAFYDRYRNKKSVIDFFDFIKEIEKLLKSEGIKLEKKFNKHYCGFKYGFFNVFSISWTGTKSFGFRVRMKENDLKKFILRGIEMNYDRGQGTYKITQGETHAKKFLPIIRYAMAMKVED
ncbi:MAG: hypothetical protein AABZ32_07270 [Bacteroidota bacterium]